jgi:hypothetical protein
MEKKEKPLEKMTAKELREMALGLPGIHGVHAMKKEELIIAIRAAKGITEPEPKKEKKVSVRFLKRKAKEEKQIQYKDIPDLHDPGLEGLDDVPRAGLEDEDDEVGRADASSSACPTPTVSMKMRSSPKASRMSAA